MMTDAPMTIVPPRIPVRLPTAILHLTVALLIAAHRLRVDHRLTAAARIRESNWQMAISNWQLAIGQTNFLPLIRADQH
jgi:hypothetical protein